MNTMSLLVIFVVLVSITACETVTPAPGAEKVTITKVGYDVANCAVLGNIKVPLNSDGQSAVTNPDVEFKNQAMGLGGNTAFVTLGTLDFPKTGIAYRCP
ncbi:MAG TPA: hypothetical protein VHL14_15630 [Steroidobacteraceae bacterium]|nr:hypothetical protein [Steroidobacteraceae bacterium]